MATVIFLLGKRFARESGMTLLPEEKVLELYGRRVLIMHGDTLCTDDAGYQAFSRQSPQTPAADAIPRSAIVCAQTHCRANAREQQKKPTAVNRWRSWTLTKTRWSVRWKKHQVQWLIHGHTHRPAVHELIANQQPAFRVVLGAWHTEGSMVKVTADDVELIHFPFLKNPQLC